MLLVCSLNSGGSEWDPVASFIEHGNEPLGSIKGEFLDYLSNC